MNELTLGPLTRNEVERDARQQGMAQLQTQASLHLLPLLLRHGHHVLEHRLAGPGKDLSCAWTEKILEGVPS